MMDSNISNPSIPFDGPLPGPLKPGSLIKIFGVVSSSATCFSINLQNGPNNYQRSDIALHLSPVFTSPPRLVRNSLEDQKWGPEESHGPPFPLITSQGFEILILAETDHFKIAINGQHFTEFHYRLSLQNISHIAIDGDVTINFIKFEGIALSSMSSRSHEEMAKPLGFVIGPSGSPNLGLPSSTTRPDSPYDTSSLPYPMNPTFGPSPTSPSQASLFPGTFPNQYDPQSNYNPYGPSVTSTASSPYGPPPGSNLYPHQGYPRQTEAFPAQGHSSNPSQGYPSNLSQNYPSNSHGYPSNQYPAQPGPYPGTSVVYPGQEKKNEGGFLGPMAAAGAAALAGVAGSALMKGKHKKMKKQKHGYPGMMSGHGMGPASLLSGVSSLVGGNKHGHSSSSAIPIGGAVAGGAAALAGAYMLSKSPMGKIMKPKKMFKHKHKGGWGGWSSSSSSSDEE